MRSFTLVILLSVVSSLARAATTYEVGDGKSYTSIGAVPWESIAPGDTVLIYARATPYAEKFVVSVAGTAAQPVTVRGVSDVSGNRPIISGASATTRTQLDYASDERGIINIGPASTPANDIPSY